MNKESKEVKCGAKEFNLISKNIVLAREYGSIQSQFSSNVLKEVHKIETFKRYAKECYKALYSLYNVKGKKDLQENSSPEGLKHYNNLAKLLSRAKKDLQESLGIEKTSQDDNKSEREKLIEKAIKYCETYAEFEKFVKDLRAARKNAKNKK